MTKENAEVHFVNPLKAQNDATCHVNWNVSVSRQYILNAFSLFAM